jgi:hypothetical protein
LSCGVPFGASEPFSDRKVITVGLIRKSVVTTAAVVMLAIGTVNVANAEPYQRGPVEDLIAQINKILEDLKKSLPGLIPDIEVPEIGLPSLSGLPPIPSLPPLPEIAKPSGIPASP